VLACVLLTVVAGVPLAPAARCKFALGSGMAMVVDAGSAVVDAGRAVVGAGPVPRDVLGGEEITA